MPSADPPAQQCADAEYNKRWLNIWDSGLEAGKVGVLCLHAAGEANWNLTLFVHLLKNCMLSPRSLCDTQCFDASKASPALLALLDGGLDVKGKRVLVPGCGVRPVGTLCCPFLGLRTTTTARLQSIRHMRIELVLWCQQRGYDVAVLASRGAKAVGLELSDSAVRCLLLLLVLCP